MKSLKLSIILAFLLAFSACAQTTDTSTLSSAESSKQENKWPEYKNTSFKYQLSIPEKSYISGKSPLESQIFFGNIPVLSKPIGDELDIQLYAFENKSCTLGTHGISGCAKDGELDPAAAAMDECNHLSEDIFWGRADFSSEAHMHDINFPEVVKNIKCGSLHGTFALCAEKDGKAVVVCINQVTEDQKLAEDIFKTFRWTK